MARHAPTFCVMKHQTLKKTVAISGIGLHLGAKVLCRLCPREEIGVEFVRTDLPGAAPLIASHNCITQTHHATVLQQGEVTTGTPEHLLAALWCLGITNCRIELNSAEVPILDGSSKVWCDLIKQAGIAQLDSDRPEYSLKQPVHVAAGGGAVLGLPYENPRGGGLRVTVDVDFGVSYLPTQSFVSEVTAQTFVDEIAPARTFARHDWIEPLRTRGQIRGGSTDNALVLGEDEPSSPLRFSDELARHKALDLLGDVSLLFGEDGGVLHAHLVAIRAGHELHRLWMEEAKATKALCIQIN
jgi:UDP-3-O-[3-hydroxymyristoyl] N-acetylglucosamine deacetylase